MAPAQVTPEDGRDFAISLASLAVYYVVARTYHAKWHAKRGSEQREVLKGRSWLLSFVVAIVLTIQGIMQLASIAHHFATDSSFSLVAFTESDDPVTGSRALNIFFVAFCLSDLTIGMVDYRSQVAILTGWVHHTIYAAMLCWFVATASTVSFAIFGILEIPTAVLAAGSIHKGWRSDWAFGITFIATRVLYMFAIWVVAVLYVSPFRIFLITAMLMLHVYWMYGWIRGMMRKGKRGAGSNKRRGEGEGGDAEDDGATGSGGAGSAGEDGGSTGTPDDHASDGADSVASPDLEAGHGKGAAGTATTTGAGAMPAASGTLSRRHVEGSAGGSAAGTSIKPPPETIALMSAHRHPDDDAASSVSSTPTAGSDGLKSSGSSGGPLTMLALGIAQQPPPFEPPPHTPPPGTADAPPISARSHSSGSGAPAWGSRSPRSSPTGTGSPRLHATTAASVAVVVDGATASTPRA